MLKEELHLIKQSAGKANTLIENLLSTSGQKQMEKEKVNLLPILEVNLNAIKLNFEHINFEIVSSLSNAIIFGDVDYLSKALYNILENAFLASPEGKTVSVEVNYLSKGDGEDELHSYHEIPQGEYLSISISDQGIGIESDNINSIFEPFYTTRSVGEGIGLGLSVAKGIISAHDGFIFVSSQPYEGTKSIILIPVLK